MANENPQIVKQLIRKRGTIKAQITSFNKFMNDFRNRQLDNEDSIKIRNRMQKLKEVYADFDSICEELGSFDEENDHLSEQITTQEQYFDLISEAEIALEKLNSPVIPITISSEDSDERQTRVSRLKLPEATLPRFEGKYEQWLTFKDSFLSMIGSRSDISNVEKLQYLKASLKGDASRKLDVFTITGDNYDPAWNLIEETYQDERVLITRHFDLLLDMPTQERESTAGLMRLVDESRQHVASLKSLGIEIGEHIIVQIIVRKLPKITRQKWEESLQRRVFPTLKQLTEFLYGTASRIATWTSDHRGGTQTSENKTHIKSNKPTKTFVTTVSSKCAVCSEDAHPIYKCEKFRNLPVQQRIKFVKDASLCANCLRTHGSKECRFGNCPRCGERHNSLLHLETEAPKSNAQK